MQRKKVTRTFEMTVERRERVTIQQRERSQVDWCTECEQRELLAPLPEIAHRAAIKQQREIFRLIECGGIGFVELSEVGLLVCVECVNNAISGSFGADRDISI